MERRSFLSFKSQASSEPWEQFCARLRRFVEGPWESLEPSVDGFPQARLHLSRPQDFEHVRALALEYDVALVLDGTLSFGQLTGRAGLWLTHSADVAAVDYFSDEACLAQAGAKVGELAAQGYEQFLGVPPYLSVAQWFAEPSYHDVRPGCSFLSGVERIHAVFADGAEAVMGDFGVNDVAPLKTALLHRSIPAIFEMLYRTPVREALAAEVWAYAYRFEALKQKHVEPNIARLFLGHRGSLIWVQSMVIRKVPQLKRQLLSADEVLKKQAAQARDTNEDSEIKQLFDPTGLYPYLDELFLRE